MLVLASIICSFFLRPGTNEALDSGWRQDQTGLQQLPQKFVNRVFDEVKRANGLKGIGQLRLVSKAWKACVMQYPREVTCRFKNDELKNICKMVLSMTSISITDTEYEGIDLGALGKCSALTKVELAITSPWGCQDYTEPVQLQDLPASVTCISVDKVYVDSNSYQMMSATQAAAITQLQVCKSDYFPGNVWSWLDYLPNLEVRPQGLHAIISFVLQFYLCDRLNEVGYYSLKQFMLLSRS